MPLSGPAYGGRELTPPRVKVTTPATAQAVTVAEAKAYARIEVTTDDAVLLPMLIRAATELVERRLRFRVLTNTVVEAFYSASPGTSVVPLPLRPVVSIAHVKTWDEAGVATTWSSANYTLDVNDDERPVLRLSDAADSWPLGTRAWSPFSIGMTVGYGASEASVPGELRIAVCELVANWYDDRAQVGKMSDVVENMIRGYVVYGDLASADSDLVPGG